MCNRQNVVKLIDRWGGGVGSLITDEDAGGGIYMYILDLVVIFHQK